MLDYIATIISEKKRATMLSIESQFRTLLIIIIAPIIGYIADIWGLKAMFFIVFFSMIFIIPLIQLSTIDKKE